MLQEPQVDYGKPKKARKIKMRAEILNLSKDIEKSTALLRRSL